MISTCSVTLHGLSSTTLLADFMQTFSILITLLPAGGGISSFCFFWMWLLILSHDIYYWEAVNSQFPSILFILVMVFKIHSQYFFSQINHLPSISTHRNNLLPFIILAALLQTFPGNFILPSGKNQNCVPKVNYRLLLWQADVHCFGTYSFPNNSYKKSIWFSWPPHLTTVVMISQKYLA